MVTKNVRREHGFTLLEVLISTSLLAVLATIAVVGFSAAQKFSQRRACTTDVRSVVTAIGAYGNDWFATGPTDAFPNMDLYSKTTASGKPLNNIVPTYLSPLSLAQGYRISLAMIGQTDRTWSYTITLAKQPAGTPTATLSSTQTSADEISTACKTVIP